VLGHDGAVISTALARRLHDAGLRWAPISGDAFQISGHDFEGDVFTVSDMTIEAHRYPTGTVLGFNGTTEWALDSVALEDALWLPREDQLRELLRDTFVSLERVPRGTSTAYVVTTRWGGREHRDEQDDAAEAYGCALLRLLEASA
jgi:hypothetical protein